MYSFPLNWKNKLQNVWETFKQKHLKKLQKKKSGSLEENLKKYFAVAHNLKSFPNHRRNLKSSPNHRRMTMISLLKCVFVLSFSMKESRWWPPMSGWHRWDFTRLITSSHLTKHTPRQKTINTAAKKSVLGPVHMETFPVMFSSTQKQREGQKNSILCFTLLPLTCWWG